MDEDVAILDLPFELAIWLDPQSLPHFLRDHSLPTYGYCRSHRTSSTTRHSSESSCSGQIARRGRSWLSPWPPPGSPAADPSPRPRRPGGGATIDPNAGGPDP